MASAADSETGARASLRRRMEGVPILARLFRFLRQPRQWDFALLLFCAAISVSIWAFAAVADEVLEGKFQVAEEHLMRSLRAPDDASRPIGPAWLMEVSRDITALGGPTVLTLMTALVMGFLLLEKMVHAAWLVAFATFGGFSLTFLLKEYFARPRPSIVPHLMNAITASFPSGHTMLSSIVYLTLGALLARAVARRRVKLYFIGTALLLTFAIGLSRVYLGVHYPSDVLAGWAGGTAWALLCWVIARWLQRRGAVEHLSPRTGEATTAPTGV